jgi:hypothetical protein
VKFSFRIIFSAVGDAVEQAHPHQLDLRVGNADVGAVGADAVRHHRRLLALDPGEDRGQAHQEGDHVDHEHRVDEQVLGHAASPLNTSAACCTWAGLSNTAFEAAQSALEVAESAAALEGGGDRQHHIGRLRPGGAEVWPGG